MSHLTTQNEQNPKRLVSSSSSSSSRFCCNGKGSSCREIINCFITDKKLTTK